MPKFFNTDHPVAIIGLNTPAQFKAVGLDSINLNPPTRRYYEDKAKDSVLATQASDRYEQWQRVREHQVRSDVLRGLCYFPDDRRLFRYIEIEKKFYRIYSDSSEYCLVVNDQGESTYDVVKSEIRKFFKNSVALEKFFFINCYQGIFFGSSVMPWSIFLRPNSFFNYVNFIENLAPADQLAYEESVFKSEPGNIYTYTDNGLYFIQPLINGMAGAPNANQNNAYELDAKIKTTVRIQAVN